MDSQQDFLRDAMRRLNLTRDAFAEAWEKTKDSDGMTLVVAINYGGRGELAATTGKIPDGAASARQGADPDSRQNPAVRRACGACPGGKRLGTGAGRITGGQ